MLLLIGGHPRSGTTLLQQLCQSHPNMAVTNELGNLIFQGEPYQVYAREMINRWRNVKGKWAYNLAHAPKNKLLAINNLKFTLLHLLQLRQFVEDKKGVVTYTHIEAVLRGAFPEAQIVGDKWPRYLYLMDRFVDEPDLLRLIIYRDCRDVTSSFLKQARTNWQSESWIGLLDTADKIAKRWVQGIEIMEKYAGQMYIMRYEDLIQQPRKEFEILGAWLGVDPSSFPTNMVNPASIGKHQDGLTAEELDTVLKIAGPTMERLGYAL